MQILIQTQIVLQVWPHSMFVWVLFHIRDGGVCIQIQICIFIFLYLYILVFLYIFIFLYIQGYSYTNMSVPTQLELMRVWPLGPDCPLMCLPAAAVLLILPVTPRSPLSSHWASHFRQREGIWVSQHGCLASSRAGRERSSRSNWKDEWGRCCRQTHEWTVQPQEPDPC